ncbi:MAG: ATP-dependent sacrificial sulfur transferase LarE [Phycisphaerae bacterium]|nr:ATP-dependent sacrificial sulfur transferase LarE [Phycisphaerae bacterium]
MDIQKKYQTLQEILKEYGKAAVAFSGGVDSSFLLKACAETLGRHNVLACIGISPSLSGYQLQQARRLAELIGVRLIEVRLHELDDPNYTANRADRCFHCKSCQFRMLGQAAAAEGFRHLLCGSNYDDQDDYRPGNRAAQMLGIASPLMQAALTKSDIRQLSRQLGLPTAEEPASPCLASRIAYGQPITEAKLAQVEQAEAFLRSLGFREFRVRHHGTVARLEIPPQEIEKAAGPELRKHITEELKKLGFCYIALDLEGFRSGSLNEMLTDAEKNTEQQPPNWSNRQ